MATCPRASQKKPAVASETAALTQAPVANCTTPVMRSTTMKTRRMRGGLSPAPEAIDAGESPLAHQAGRDGASPRQSRHPMGQGYSAGFVNLRISESITHAREGAERASLPLPPAAPIPAIPTTGRIHTTRRIPAAATATPRLQESPASHLTKNATAGSAVAGRHRGGGRRGGGGR